MEEGPLDMGGCSDWSSLFTGVFSKRIIFWHIDDIPRALLFIPERKDMRGITLKNDKGEIILSFTKFHVMDLTIDADIMVRGRLV